MRQPIIITTIDSDTERYILRKKYITELERARGIPLLIAPTETLSLENIYPMMDGLCLTGGDDIHPSFFHENIAPHYTGKIDVARDHLEHKLITHALAHNIPIFGICRGMQALNVFLGGSLYQDIAHERKGALTHKFPSTDRTLRSHEITLEKNSQLAHIIGATNFSVNSIHHQGVKELGRDLVASATSPDGLIEAIELPHHAFVIGVEWHPEELADSASRKLFSHFVDAATTRKRGGLHK